MVKWFDDIIADRRSSNRFTKSVEDDRALGPPLIGALLRMPWESVQEAMLQRLHERGFEDLDAAHLNVFQYPGPQGSRPSEITARLRVTKQAVSYLLRELSRLGYLELRSDEVDRRSKRIALTPRGVAAVHAIREAVGEVEAAWSERLGPKRFAQLRELLLELNER